MTQSRCTKPFGTNSKRIMHVRQNGILTTMHLRVDIDDCRCQLSSVIPVPGLPLIISPYGIKISGAVTKITLSSSLLAGMLVERSLLLVIRPCPFIVSLLSGKYCAAALMVRPSHDAYCLFFIALIHDGLVGKPAHAWRYRTNSGCVLSL